MYLSGTSMSASPIPIFGSPCSWARLFVRDQGTRAGFRPLKAGWLLSALVGLIVQIICADNRAGPVKSSLALIN